jgi:hypothetical protein
MPREGTHVVWWSSKTKCIRSIFEGKDRQLIGEWRKLHYEGNHLWSSPDIAIGQHTRWGSNMYTVLSLKTWSEETTWGDLGVDVRITLKYFLREQIMRAWTTFMSRMEPSNSWGPLLIGGPRRSVLRPICKCGTWFLCVGGWPGIPWRRWKAADI